MQGHLPKAVPPAYFAEWLAPEGAAAASEAAPVKGHRSPSVEWQREFFIGKGENRMETRVAVLAILVREPDSVAALNDLLHQYGERIVGRMGVPYRARGVNIISVALDAPETEISALSGKIGRLPGVTAKTVYAPEEALNGKRLV